MARGLQSGRDKGGGEMSEEEDLDPPINFNLERMKQAVEGGTISIPVGLTHEERREYIRDRLEEMEDKE